MPQVIGVLVTTVAATADVVSIGVNDLVIVHVVAPIGGRTTNIGYPKLFNGGAVGRRESPAAPTVNNFVAASAARDFGWPRFVI
jgi:hypothetical protein